MGTSSLARGSCRMPTCAPPTDAASTCLARSGLTPFCRALSVLTRTLVSGRGSFTNQSTSTTLGVSVKMFLTCLATASLDSCVGP
jgi:hypothetical protein